MVKLKPWEKTFCYIEKRCKERKYYADKGIKNFLTVKDLGRLWKRDRAFRMKRPSIDRINSNGHYEIGNCRYLELSENIRLGALGNRNTRGRHTQTPESRLKISLASKRMWSRSGFKKWFLTRRPKHYKRKEI